jgi:membrane fusion protein, multidrug efflux system
MSEQTSTTRPEPVLPKQRARRMFMILGAVVVLLVIAYGAYALLTSNKEKTDDAQVASDVVAVAPRIAGQVVQVFVHDNQHVRAGDLLVQLDPRDAEVKVQQATSELATATAQADAADARFSVARATAHGGLTTAQAAVESSQQKVGTQTSAIAEARAAVTRAEANAQKAHNDWSRAQELGGKGDISKAQVDAARAGNEAAQAELAQARAHMTSAEQSKQQAQADVQQAVGRLQQTAPVDAQIRAAQADAALAHARVDTARAALAAAQLNLSYARITAPRDGIASRLMVHGGSLVTPGQPVVQLVPLQTYVIANFKETQVRAMRPGQHATVKVDALDGEFDGTLESLSGGTGSTFSLLPPDNASGNYVKVVQRVPVRVKWSGPPSDRVPVGASAEVTVYTK